MNKTSVSYPEPLLSQASHAQDRGLVLSFTHKCTMPLSAHLHLSSQAQCSNLSRPNPGRPCLLWRPQHRPVGHFFRPALKFENLYPPLGTQLPSQTSRPPLYPTSLPRGGPRAIFSLVSVLLICSQQQSHLLSMSLKSGEKGAFKFYQYLGK